MWFCNPSQAGNQKQTTLTKCIGNWSLTQNYKGLRRGHLRNVEKSKGLRRSQIVSRMYKWWELLKTSGSKPRASRKNLYKDEDTLETISAPGPSLKDMHKYNKILSNIRDDCKIKGNASRHTIYSLLWRVNHLFWRDVLLDSRTPNTCSAAHAR